MKILLLLPLLLGFSVPAIAHNEFNSFVNDIEDGSSRIEHTGERSIADGGLEIVADIEEVSSE